jgi:hypothetical protein
VEDRISELEDKTEINEKKKKKPEEILVKLLKNCKRNMQELSDSNKRPNLRIMGTEGEECKPKGYITYSIK